MLHRLRAAGCRVWPFDACGFPLVLEVYPRLLTGKVRKSSREARERFVRERTKRIGSAAAIDGVRVDACHLMLACESEDAFDALFSAVAMFSCIDELQALPRISDAADRLEGAIWRPNGNSLDRRNGSALSRDTPLIELPHRARS
jgi:hypothetical protein